MSQILDPDRTRYLSKMVGFGRLASALCLLAAAVPCAADLGAGYLRTVEGRADLLSGGTPPAIEVSGNYPVQVGDQLRVAQGGNLELAFPDQSLIRVAGNSDLKLSRIALSVITQDNQNEVQLLQGEIHVSVISEPKEQPAYRIDTANASLYLLSRGSYRVFTDGRSWTQVVIRDGFVQIATEGQTHQGHAGQQMLIDGAREPSVTIQAAPPIDSLERWAQRLDAEADAVLAAASLPSGTVSPRLRYAATPLYRHGHWMDYRGSRVWKPNVGSGWRPYHSGWWVYTSAGLTWVSTEPFGWVVYHYGTWGYGSNIGWVWRPGDRYTPGAVYWYWGPSHVAWTPADHYESPTTRYSALPPYGNPVGIGTLPNHPYRGRIPRSHRVHAGSERFPGDWRDWTFSSYDDFGFRYNHRSLATGADLERRGIFKAGLPDGVLTTDTRGLTPNLWSDPDRIRRALDTSPPTMSRPSGLSPLGTAATSGSLTHPLQVEGRQIERIRQWDPKQWRRDHSQRPQASNSGSVRRDAPGTSGQVRGHDSSVRSRRPGQRSLHRPKPGSSSSRHLTPTHRSGSHVRPAPPSRSRTGAGSSGRISSGSKGRSSGGKSSPKRPPPSRPDGSG